jgi:hypothetical protein
MEVVLSGENRPLPIHRRRRPRLALVGLSCAALALGPTVVWVSAVGNTVYVDDNPAAGCAAGNGQQGSPYCKIQDAVCVAQSGDTVSVAPGTYTECIRMKPGVSVISQNGAAGTTINGAGQPCTNADYCTKAAGNTCSVVTFPGGHTTTTSITGFTIRQGAGSTGTQTVSGGGISVFSSPTISNNVITQNVLSGPRRKFYGGGIYVAQGSPIITGNTITGNRAVPAAGISGSPTYGYGGGIYVGFFSSPTITNNVISSNVAGDPNLAFSLGGGGGIAAFPGDASNPGILIDRNTITDNTADTEGGGICLSSIVGTQAQAIVSNNVIVGNISRWGGGLYTYYNKSKTVNNTIVDNLAQNGGGVYSGQSDATRPVIISNNAITGNRLNIGGSGGGIYTYSGPAFNPTFENNDCFGNQKNCIAGDLTDASFIGLSGNFAADPTYVNLAGRNFHLNNNSPAIDRALASRAPLVDRDNLPRGIDGNGFPNSPQAGDNDVGAYEWRPPCLPVTETCNGIDDDCDSQIDEGFTNTDGDTMANCVDPDDDNDLVQDASDCAPLNNTAWGVPTEVSNLQAVDTVPTGLSWAGQNIGTATQYAIATGTVTSAGSFSFPAGTCLPTVTTTSTTDTRTAPALGQMYYYLVKSRNVCGAGTWGTPARDTHPACP